MITAIIVTAAFYMLFGLACYRVGVKDGRKQGQQVTVINNAPTPLYPNVEPGRRWSDQ